MSRIDRRNFLKLGALFVPVVAAPTVAYSFLWARPQNTLDLWAEVFGTGRAPGETDDDLSARLIHILRRPLAAALQIPERILWNDPKFTLETPKPGEKPRAFAW